MIIAAAGVGSRMQSDTPKQYLSLAGQPVLLQAMRPFITHERVSRIVVVHDAHDTRIHELVFPSGASVELVEGGDTRADSVQCGLIHLMNSDDAERWVMVHDAARPLVSTDAINRLLALQTRDGCCGGLLAIPVTDTIKEGDNGFSIRTPAREALWAAQTPQLFPAKTLSQALRDAKESGLMVTDEASAIELTGGKPVLVQGDSDNLKITHPGDLVRAEAILAANTRGSWR